MRNKKIEEYISALKEQRYFEAHEALEVLWFPRRFEESSEVKLLKGLINAAVSFELRKRGRLPQSKKVWKNYLKYRQELFKIEQKHRNNYYQLTRFIENHALAFYSTDLKKEMPQKR